MATGRFVPLGSLVVVLHGFVRVSSYDYMKPLDPLCYDSCNTDCVHITSVLSKQICRKYFVYVLMFFRLDMSSKYSFFSANSRLYVRFLDSFLNIDD